MEPLQMLDLRSGTVMLKYSDIQVGEMILQSHGNAADAGPPLRGCHAQVFRHTGRRNDPCAAYIGIGGMRIENEPRL